MSKNVAVFVDVANIFYAAKAAGVDIDYVTLLKAAIAGRDFVRAYAYTGLDPENENQRQFHSFLGRSGYKVVSKDVRKYGDGKIKANLDIELVVDLMRTARNLDVAVVVSGDGDFAPAIRAVQQQGVRVEVISFRGNTSSDLMEVADVFTDITQIARVEKGSRSGRRVAAGDDLSMTEVPDKETEGAPRRRRTRTTRTDRVAVAGTGREPAAARASAPARGTTSTGGQLIVLPGEKLSRAGANGEAADGDGLPATLGEEAVAPAALPTPLGDDGEGPETEAGAGRRRRRRRGGRGRGRGRGGERELVSVADQPADQEPQDEDEAEYEAPRLPQHSTFGSVWDSQLGVGQTPSAAGSPDVTDEPYDDEPEIPEYLLAERRQRGQRGAPRGGRGGGRAAAYQSAVERERYGRPGAGSFGGPRREAPNGPRREPGAGPRRDGGRRDDRSRGGRRDRPPQRMSTPRSVPPAPSGGSDPWSEVPPELEEMLRAQLSTGGGRSRPEASEAGTSTLQPLEPSALTTEAGAEAVEGPAAPKRRTPSRRTSAKSASTESVSTEEAGSESATPKRRAATRRTATKASSAGATDGAAGDPSDAEASSETPKKRATRRSPRAKAEEAASTETTTETTEGSTESGG